jgi:diaminopimelate decarboxylase
MNRGRIRAILRAALSEGVLGEQQPLVAFVDNAGVEAAIRDLHEAFPDHFDHMFAAKANPMRRALELVRTSGMGCEVASPGELEQALRCGFRPGQIVYDQPAKTMDVLQRILEAGIGLNIDNFQEFDRVRSIAAVDPSCSRIGFRINPQVGAGHIDAMSTATATSKFGVSLEDDGNREHLLDCYRQQPWLTTLHAHVGSQGCPLDLMAAGIRKLVDLALEIDDTVGSRQVELIDIGGGLPVNFEGEEVKPTFSDYAAVLRETVPELFNGRFRGKTEFGRSIFAKNGFIASRVEYTKTSGGRRIALTHAGAQVATRTVFMPEHWKIRVSVFGPGGEPKTAEPVAQDIGGPLCFAGDKVASGRELPLIEPGDYVVLHDTGAYYFSNPFYYNVLPAPPVFGVASGPNEEPGLESWRQAQEMDDMLAVIG